MEKSPLAKEIISEWEGIKTSSLRLDLEREESFLYGRSYHYQSNDSGKIRGKCLFLHDMGEHSSRYQDFFHSFLKSHPFDDFEIVTLDLRGHGKSCGTRGHIPSLNQLCFDAIKLLNEFKDFDGPLFIWGIGLGGIISLKIIHSHFSFLKKGIDGVLLINPALKLKWQLPTAIELLLGSGISSLQRLKLPFAIEGASFAGDSFIAEEFDSDPLVNHSLTWSSILEIQQHASKIRTSAYYLDLPVFMGLSGHQHFYSNQVSELFSRGIASCTLKQYRDSYHDIFHHFDCEKLAQDVYNWLEENFNS